MQSKRGYTMWKLFSGFCIYIGDGLNEQKSADKSVIFLLANVVTLQRNQVNFWM